MGLEGLNNLPLIIQLVDGGTQIRVKTFMILKFVFSPLCYTLPRVHYSFVV